MAGGLYLQTVCSDIGYKMRDLLSRQVRIDGTVFSDVLIGDLCYSITKARLSREHISSTVFQIFNCSHVDAVHFPELIIRYLTRSVRCEVTI